MSAPLPAELLAVLHTAEFEDGGRLSLRTFHRADAGCTLALDLVTGVDGEPAQGWRFHCADCLEYRLSSGWMGTMHLVTPPHVLLARWTDPYATLWFSGPTTEPGRIAEALARRHQRQSEGFSGLPTWLNGAQGVSKVLELGIGLLAEGPVSILREYASVLCEHGLEPSLREYQPNHVDGRRPDWDRESLGALTLGDSYVVGTGWRVERL